MSIFHAIDGKFRKATHPISSREATSFDGYLISSFTLAGQAPSTIESKSLSDIGFLPERPEFKADTDCDTEIIGT
jgi:hypothetical protein